MSTKKELLELCSIFNLNIKKNSTKNVLEDALKKQQLKFIDLFCGIGGFHQVLNKLNHKCVYACDIDKKCREVYEKNYGIMPDSDIRNLDPTTLEDFDILCGGFPCFIAGTKVLTYNGYKNIEDVFLNDKLMTHSGKFQNILNLQRKNYSGNLYKIKIKYHPSYINCTEEHPFYIREKKRTWNVEVKKYDIIFKQAEWKNAKELTKNDYFGMKINENSIIPEFYFEKKINQFNTIMEYIKLDNPDMWFMMGYFIGDGWIEETKKKDLRIRNNIRFAINNKDFDKVYRRIVNILPITDKKCPSGEKCNKYGCCNFVWFNILKSFGKYAHGKIIPEWVQDAPKEYIEQFIDGYRTADGCVNNKECYSFTTVSYNLAFGLQRLYLKLGHLFSITKFIRPKTTVIEGRTVNQRDTYQIQGYIKENKREYSSFIENGYVWYAPFKLETQSVENEPVYNFEVENDNSYIVENTISHNCQSFSNGGKKKAFEDDRGLLFDEIMRIVKVKNPKFLFLENVKHILKVDEGKVFEYILDKLDKYGYNVEWKKMSPHEYGIPQQRERIYFICVRKDLYKEPIQLIYQKVPDIDVKLFLDNKQDIDQKYFIKGDLLECLNAWDKMVKKFEVGEKISPTIMSNDFNTKIDDDDFTKLPSWKKEYITKNRPLYIKYKKDWDDWVKENKSILDKRKIYAQLDWQTGPIVENDSIFNHFMQVRQSGIRVKKSKYFPTLVAISQIPIYGKEKRYITPRECARIQSFPDDFILDTDDKVSYKQLGNSVNVDNVRNIVESTLKLYGLV